MMDVTISSNIKFFILILFFSVIVFYSSSGNAEDINPVEMIPKALFCFNKNFIYSSCEEAHRLDQIGYLNVPRDATDEFCNGPCLVETQLVLNCIDNILSNFFFYNKATIQDIRYTLHGGCSFTSQRGNFNVGDYIQGETSNGHRLYERSSLLTIVLLASGFCFLILYRIGY